MEMVHKLRINCGMMLGAWMRGVIRLFNEKPAAVPVDLFLDFRLSYTLKANRLVLVCLCKVYCLSFSSGILLECDSGSCN